MMTKLPNGCYAVEIAPGVEVVDGRADAWIVGTAKVMPIARNLKNENRRLHLVSIPYDQRLQDLYLPSEFTSDEYPNLIPPGEKVDTVAAGILLAVFNWPEKSERYQKVARFVDALFSRIRRIRQTAAPPEMEGGECFRGHTRVATVQARAGLDRSLACATPRRG